MNELEYNTKINSLFEKWKTERNYKVFVKDGILEYDVWETLKLENKPKILFLLKESYGKYLDKISGEMKYFDNLAGEKWPRDEVRNSKWSYNILRWQYAIYKMYNYIGVKPPYPNEEELPENLEGLALVNVKKLNENKSKTDNKEIYQYAKNDSKFLIEEIDIINPDIILCCYTEDGYADNIAQNEYKIMKTLKNCHTIKDGNRLVIDYWHPSKREDDEILYNDLCELLENGEVFNNFNW